MQPTPTRSPTWNLVTPGPTSVTMPAISWPGTIGKMPSPQPSRAWWMSEWQIPANLMSIRTSYSRDRAALDGGALQGSLRGGGGVRSNSGHAEGLLAVVTARLPSDSGRAAQPARPYQVHPGHGFAYVQRSYHWRGQDGVRTTVNTGRMDEQPDPVQRARPAPLDRRAELSEFLRTRRARLKPEDVGLPDFGRHRRVPGLRREELAQLAGVSVAYYTRLEQGNGRNVSAEVLDAIARALRLTDAEHAHLTHLAKPKQHKKKPAGAQPAGAGRAAAAPRHHGRGSGLRRGAALGDPGLEPDGGGGLRRLGASCRPGAELGAAGVPAACLPGAVHRLGAEGDRHRLRICAWTRAATRTTPGCPRWSASCP